MSGESFWFFANYADYERGLSSMMISLAMLGMGASLTVRDFANVFVVWKALAVGMGVQIVLAPVGAGILLALLAQVPSATSGLSAPDIAGLALGVALIAAMPGGSTSNLLAFLARGNVALSVTLTAFATFVCLVTTPVVVELLIAVQSPGLLELDALRIVRDIALFLIAPLLAGLLAGHVLKHRRARFTSIMVNSSLVVLGVIVIGSLGAGRVDLPRYGWFGPLVVAALCVCLTQLGKYTARLSGLVERDCVTINIEISVKNVLLALLLITTMFPHAEVAAMPGARRAVIEAARDGCTYLVLAYGAACLIAGAVTVTQHRIELAIAQRRARNVD